MKIMNISAEINNFAEKPKTRNENQRWIVIEIEREKEHMVAVTNHK